MGGGDRSGTARPPREGDFRGGLVLGYKSLGTSSAYELTGSAPAVSSSVDLDPLDSPWSATTPSPFSSGEREYLCCRTPDTSTGRGSSGTAAPDHNGR